MMRTESQGKAKDVLDRLCLDGGAAVRCDLSKEQVGLEAVVRRCGGPLDQPGGAA